MVNRREEPKKEEVQSEKKVENPSMANVEEDHNRLLKKYEEKMKEKLQHIREEK